MRAARRAGGGVGAAGVAALGAAVALAACTSRDAGPSSTAGDGAALAGDQPSLTLAPARLDAGSFAVGALARVALTARNDGAAPLTILRVEASRFCRAALAPGAAAAILAPGASTTLGVECRADLAGPLRERLFVDSDDPRAPRQPVEIAGTVLPLLAFDVPAVTLTMPFGEPREAEARLTGVRATDAHLALPAAVPAELELALLPNGAGLRVRCKARAAGLHAGHLELPTGLPPPLAAAGLSWSCKVAGTLAVDPNPLYFNLKDPDYPAQIVEVRSTQPGFKIASARVTAGPFTAALVPGDPPRVRISVDRARVRTLGPDAHGATGFVVLRSNDRSEPRKEIPILGFGRAAGVANGAGSGPGAAAAR